MLTVLDILMFVLFVVFLVALIAQNDSNMKKALKIQSYACIAALSIEVISLVVRFLLSNYWVPVFIVLIAHSIVSTAIILEAKDYGVFEKKRNNRDANVDVVV